VAGNTKNHYCLHLSPQWSLWNFDRQIRVKGLKSKALVTYLAIESATAHNREKLAAIFWPDVEQNKARASLRQAVSGLKTIFADNGEDILLLSNDQIGLRDGHVVTNIELALTDIEAGQIDTLRMRQIAGVKNMLDELETVSDMFAEWLRETRTFLTRRTIDRLKTVFNDKNYPPEFRNCVAETASLLDDLNEDAVRTLMASHAELNNSVTALRIYGEFCKTLEDFLDAEPSIETQDLAVQIKLSQGRESASPKTAARSVIAVPEIVPVVTVAVLPLEVLGRNNVPDHILIGLLDHITCQLATCRAPAVISSNTTRCYLGMAPQPSEVGQALNVNYVVSGTLRVDDSCAAISIQLSNTRDNRVVWANTHQCDVTELYTVKNSLADDIVQAIIPSVNVAELKRTWSTPTTELEPYHLVLRAKDLIFRLSHSEFVQAGTLLKQAIHLGPHFAPAHALLAEWFAIAVWQGWSQDFEADRQELERHVRQAVSLSPGDGRALALWAHTKFMFDHQHEQPLALLEKAIELCPNDSETLIWSVPALGLTGSPDEAIKNGSRAISLSPLDPFMFRNEHFLSLVHYVNGDFDTAAEFGQSSYVRVPNYASNLRGTIASLVAAGRQQEVGPLVARHNQIEPEFSVENYIQNISLREAKQKLELADRLISAGLPS